MFSTLCIFKFLIFHIVFRMFQRTQIFHKRVNIHGPVTCLVIFFMDRELDVIAKLHDKQFYTIAIFSTPRLCPGSPDRNPRLESLIPECVSLSTAPTIPGNLIDLTLSANRSPAENRLRLPLFREVQRLAIARRCLSVARASILTRLRFRIQGQPEMSRDVFNA